VEEEVPVTFDFTTVLGVQVDGVGVEREGGVAEEELGGRF
jgi:hypothetical protein